MTGRGGPSEEDALARSRFRSPAVDHVDDRETIGLLQEILHFHTENPPGNEAPLARFLADHLAGLGFETRCYESEPGRASLVARLRGTGGSRSLGLSGHLDIGPIGTGGRATRGGARLPTARSTAGAPAT